MCSKILYPYCSKKIMLSNTFKKIHNCYVHILITKERKENPTQDCLHNFFAFPTMKEEAMIISAWKIITTILWCKQHHLLLNLLWFANSAWFFMLDVAITCWRWLEKLPDKRNINWNRYISLLHTFKDAF